MGTFDFSVTGFRPIEYNYKFVVVKQTIFLTELVSSAVMANL